MKSRMLKRLLTVVVLIASAVSFATAESYASLLAKGKEYEKNKQYIHALGSYWDAMEAEPENAEEALEAYTKLGKTIESGKPGYGEFDEFDMYYGWLALCKDFEQYWTEVCPVGFSPSLSKGDLDMATRTASYTLTVNVFETSRSASIWEFVEHGLEANNFSAKAGKKWPGIPKGWPLFSVYNTGDNEFKKSGVATIEFTKQDKGKILPSSVALSSVHAGMFADTMNLPGMYDTKFNFLDEDGNVLLTSGRTLAKGQYEFKGVPQSTMKRIDAGKVYFEMTDLYLEYGKLTSPYDKSSRNWLKSLPEIKMDVTKVEFGERGLKATEKAITAITKKKLKPMQETVLVNGLYVRTMMVRKEEVFLTLGSKGSLGGNIFPYQGTFSIEEQAFEPAGVAFDDAIKFCNALSEADGLPPCYTRYGREWLWTDSNGWRLPTENEWVQIVAGDRNTFSDSSFEWVCPNADTNVCGWSENSIKKRKYSLVFSEQNFYVACIRLVRDSPEKIIADKEKRNAEEEKKREFHDLLEKNKIPTLDTAVRVKGGSFDFYMQKTEVTQLQYEAVTGNNPSYYKGTKHPVEGVSPLETIKYCNLLSEMQGLEPCYSLDGVTDVSKWSIGAINREEIQWNKDANGWRLPTEEEWEYAAREGERNSQYKYSGSDDIDEVAWYRRGERHDVATKKPNALGLYDMSGNVSELCWGSDGGCYSRGGGVGINMEYCAVLKKDDSVFSRHSFSDSNRGSDGFRLVRNASESTAVKSGKSTEADKSGKADKSSKSKKSDKSDKSSKSSKSDSKKDKKSKNKR